MLDSKYIYVHVERLLNPTLQSIHCCLLQLGHIALNLLSVCVCAIVAFRIAYIYPNKRNLYYSFGKSHGTSYHSQKGKQHRILCSKDLLFVWQVFVPTKPVVVVVLVFVLVRFWYRNFWYLPKKKKNIGHLL